MVKEVAEQKRKVLCPECGAEVPIDDQDNCPKCDLNVQRVLDKDRYDRALENLRKARENESGAKKKSTSDDPFSY